MAVDSVCRLSVRGRQHVDAQDDKSVIQQAQ